MPTLFRNVFSSIRISVLFSCLIWLASFAAPAPVAAQITSSIDGHVTDGSGSVIPNAQVTVTSKALGIERRTTTNGEGEFVFSGLQPGIYDLHVAAAGFAESDLKGAELMVNQTYSPAVKLTVAAVVSQVTVTEAAPELETEASSTGTTITPQQIEDMPINGRNYLDLMQLVPGVAIERQANDGSDATTPILGERAGNADFLIDGLPNNDYLNGGAATQFNQDAILEFQVITSSYKAEFGHSSGGVINVVSRSGANSYHGLVSVFHRNSVLDASDNSLPSAPFLLRWDPSAQVGGPLRKDQAFFFASAERIMESRQLNFTYPAGLPSILTQQEAAYDKHSMTNDTRGRLRLDEHLGQHQISEQFNYTNNHVSDYLPLSETENLPSTRGNIGQRYLMLGGTDNWLIGNAGNPFLVTSYLQYRNEPSQLSASHPQAGISNTLDNLFSSLNTGDLFGDEGQVSYGAGYTPLVLDQVYWSAGSNASKHLGNHEPKIGWDLQHTHVDGTEATSLFNQLFSTEADLATYGPIDSGVYYLSEQGGNTPAENNIKLRNYYDGIFAQDDWKIRHNVTLNLGVRWDYDSDFPNTANISPRLGVAWNIFPKTVIHASYGIFYDHFRLGIARDIPGFGGATVVSQKYLSFPRLFYGDPSTLVTFFNSIGRDVPCISSNMTDAQIAAAGIKCNGTSAPVYGIDHLNYVVASGHGAVPANAVVNETNVQQLTGLSPSDYLAAAAAAINEPSGYFTWDFFNNLSIHNAFAQYAVPVTVASGFKTPNSTAIHFGIQQAITPTLDLAVDYYHRNINNILGVRVTNLAFSSREVNQNTTYSSGSERVLGYGPWLDGFYDGFTAVLTKRVSHTFTGALSYTFAKEWDDALNSSLDSDAQTNGGATYIGVPTDSYVGPVPEYTDPVSGQTNTQHGYIASNGNYIPKEQAHYNGPGLDYGPSDLSIPQTLLAHGIWDLPYHFQFSGIFRAQSGFAYTLLSNNPPDVDGDGLYGGRDLNFIRNSNRAPKFVNMDTRVSKAFSLGESKRLNLYFEMFNLFNNANMAGITQYETLPGNAQPPTTTETLPGREGQAGLRFDF